MTATTTTSNNRPTHKLYRVVKGRTKEDKTLWTEVAACWPHKDGSGFNVKFKFNEAPANGGEYVMRRDTPKTTQSVGPRFQHGCQHSRPLNGQRSHHY